MIIKNGIIVTGTDTSIADIFVKNNRIAQIGSINPSGNEQIIDATGKYILPGGIDVHTHLDLDTGTTKTADNFYTGTRAAIAGGTTTVVDFATQDKGGTLSDAVTVWMDKAKDSFCDYGFHMAMVDWNDKIEAEMQDMMDAGISSFKLYMAYKGSLQVDDGIIYKALQRSADIGGLIGFHCENGDLVATMCQELIAQGKTSPYYHPKSRPDTVEEEAIFRLSKIAQLANAPIWVVHLSTQKGLQIIQAQKQLGIHIVTETCPQYLLLDDSNYGSEADSSFEGAKYVISPPLRKQADVEAMWRGVQERTIDFVSTDHCSFNLKGQKDLGRDNFTKIPNGGPGLEHRMMLLYHFGVAQNRISINHMVQLLAETPGKMFGLQNKGSIEVGKDADIVILDPKGSTHISAATQLQNVDYTPYEGMQLKGCIDTVLLRGDILYNNGKFVADKPKGQFVKRTRGNF